jgi:hypothetical protein
MMRLPVRSRRWNQILGVLGFLYAVSATFVLVWYVWEVWNVESIIDRVFQAALLLSALCGVVLAVGARNNLGVRRQKRYGVDATSYAASIHR